MATETTYELRRFALCDAMHPDWLSGCELHSGHQGNHEATITLNVEWSDEKKPTKRLCVTHNTEYDPEQDSWGACAVAWQLSYPPEGCEFDDAD